MDMNICCSCLSTGDPIVGYPLYCIRQMWSLSRYSYCPSEGCRKNELFHEICSSDDSDYCSQVPAFDVSNSSAQDTAR